MRISDWSSDVCSSDLRAIEAERDQDLLDKPADPASDEPADDEQNRRREHARNGVEHRLENRDRRIGDRGDGERLKRRDGQRDDDPCEDDDANRSAYAYAWGDGPRSEEHPSELQSLIRLSSVVSCVKTNEQEN